jgi:D-sedoheptulose 7-phosphate isomerase
LAEHQRVMAAMAAQAPVLEAIANALIAVLRAGNRIYVFGNGGSAADAQHIAAELLGRFHRHRRALPACALSTDSSTLTAIANDSGYEQVFARQLEALVAADDVVWALSTSGNSPNVIAAVEVALRRGAVVIGFTGTPGGQLAELCTHVLRVPHQISDRIQEAHQVAYHYLCERIEEALG